MPGLVKKLNAISDIHMKARIFCMLHRMKSAWYRWRGLRIGQGCIISGCPEFRKCKGSEICLGNQVVLHSKHKYNTLIRLPISFSTIEPGARIVLHDHAGLSGCKIVCANHVEIGEYTIVGPDTVIYDCKEHEYSPEIGWLGRTQRTGKPIRIGKRCYIGMRCIILKGVTIGDDCVISAGTIITKDVPAGHLAQGNPAVYTPVPKRLTAS